MFLPLDPAVAVLLVAKRDEIIANRINIRPPQMSPVIRGSSIVTVDFDHITSRIYWADASQKKIWSAYQNGTDTREVRHRCIKARDFNHWSLNCTGTQPKLNRTVQYSQFNVSLLF